MPTLTADTAAVIASAFWVVALVGYQRVTGRALPLVRLVSAPRVLVA